MTMAVSLHNRAAELDAREPVLHARIAEARKFPR